VTGFVSKINGLGGTGSSSTSGTNSWAAEASPPLEGEGWTPGQATCVRNSSILIDGCWLELCNLCMMMIWPLCRLCSIANNVSEVNEEGPIRGAGTDGADKGAAVEEDGTVMEGAVEGSGKEGAEVSGAVEVRGASDLLPMAFLGPLNVIVGSSRFQ